MKRELELTRRLQAVRTLGEAVGAMKSLSAHHFREARRAVEPARVYREGLDRLRGWAGSTLPAGDGPAGLVVVGGELGLCGAYNAQIVEAGAARRAALGPGPTICVGRRAAALLARRQVALAATYGTPTGVRGIPALLPQIAEDLLTRYARERLSSVEIVASRFDGVGAVRPTSVRLLPFDAGVPATTVGPRYVSPEHFGLSVARELLYMTLYDLLLDALAAEHSSRLVATEAAESWLTDRGDQLRRHLVATRRETSTQEMIEIAAGARVRRGRPSP